jgi:hypothetical protein
MRHSAESSNGIEFLREFESICKTVLAHESGDPGVQFAEKPQRSKSRETVPLTQSSYRKVLIPGSDLSGSVPITGAPSVK